MGRLRLTFLTIDNISFRTHGTSSRPLIRSPRLPASPSLQPAPPPIHQSSRNQSRLAWMARSPLLGRSITPRWSSATARSRSRPSQAKISSLAKFPSRSTRESSSVRPHACFNHRIVRLLSSRQLAHILRFFSSYLAIRGQSGVGQSSSFPPPSSEIAAPQFRSLIVRQRYLHLPLPFRQKRPSRPHEFLQGLLARRVCHP